MSKTKIQDGVKVSPQSKHEAYYSGYAGNPVQFFSPGMIGVVAYADVPPVRGDYRIKHAVIDFQGAEHGVGKYSRTEWRVMVPHNDLRVVTSVNSSPG